MTERLTLLRPDDWHVHLRDGAALGVTVPATSAHFARAVVMPNLAPPITTVAAAEAYRARILEEVPEGVDFEPLMTLYLTDDLGADEIARAADSAFVVACKLYPAGATTNSAAGVSDLESIYPLLEAMQERDLPLLIHGEATAPEVDVFDREGVFIEEALAPLVERFEGLRVVLEHITTADAVRFVRGARPGVGATITPQHLLMNRNDLFRGGLRPHNYCLPVLKRREHQEALQAAALSGEACFFLGTDSAPHGRHAKESALGCAGCYSAPVALSLYAQFFADHGRLECLEAFASHYGADFYALARNSQSIVLERRPRCVPERLDYVGGDTITPFWAGGTLDWVPESGS